MSISVLLTGLIIAFTVSLASGQDNRDRHFQDLEDIQDQNMAYYIEIYDIAKNYPDFSYKYVYRDGEVKEVTVEGVSNPIDEKRLELLVYDFKQNKKRMKNIPTRTGIYYSLDDEAEPKMGYREFYRKLHTEISYPEEAKNWGVEGNVYAKFVVDKHGEIDYVTITEDLETSKEYYIDDIKKEVKDAILATSGDWKPAEVDDISVASWVVVPVKFTIETAPGLPAMVQ